MQAIKKDVKQERKKHVAVGHTGKAQSPSPLRGTHQSGPTTAVKKTEVAKVATLAAKARNVAKKKDKGSVFIVGTAPSVMEQIDTISNIIAFAQNLTNIIDVHYPHLFRHEQTQILARALFPVDLAAYFVSLMVAGHARNGSLRSAIPEATTAVPADTPVPIAVAEYIRRLHLVGAPEIVKILNLNVNPTITTGEITYSPSPFNANLSLNQNVSSNAQLVETWQFGNAPDGSLVADPNDLSAYSVNMTAAPISVTQLYGSGGWMGTRFALVVEVMKTLSLGKVSFGEIPRTTTDCSTFGAPTNGNIWATAKGVNFPRTGGNVNLCAVFNPVGRDAYFPGTVIVKAIPTPNWYVTGGLYGNSAASFPSGTWAGQPVTPTSLDFFMYATQCFLNITLHAPGLKDRVFGKNGYKFHGLIVNDYQTIMSVPVDYPALVQKCVVAHVQAINPTASQVCLGWGLITGLYLMYGAMIARKVFNSQLEIWSSLQGTVFFNTWKHQVLIPSQAYLESDKLPITVTAILNELAPVSVRGIIRCPCIGAGLLQDNWANSTLSTGEKFYLFPKWVGYAPTGTYLSNGLIPNPTAASPGNPKNWVFPYIQGASPISSLVMLDYASSAFGYDSAYTIFPASLSVVQGAVNATTGAQLDMIVAPVGPVYDEGTLVSGTGVTWVAGAIQAGKIAYLAFQYAGARSAVKAASKLLSTTSKVNANQLLSPSVRGVVGGSSMSTNLQYTVNYANTKPQLSVMYQELNSDNLPTGGAGPLYYAMDYHAGTIIQAMDFCNAARLACAFTIGASAFPISAQSSPPGLGIYTVAPYTANMEDLTTFGVFQDFIVQATQEGTAINKYIQRMSARGNSKAEQEQVFFLREPNATEDLQVSTAGLIKYAESLDLPKNITEISAVELEDSIELAKHGQMDQVIAMAGEFSGGSKIEDLEDASAQAIFGKAWSGIKWAAPKVLKVAAAAAPLLI